MRHLILILFALITTIAIHHTHAQETTPEPYPIVERCLTDLREPPDEWTFEGTIVTYRLRDGVHGFRSDFPTRYYIAFDSQSEFASSGSFSPDGQWFAIPVGRLLSYGMVNSVYRATGIKVVSTIPSTESYRVPYEENAFAGISRTALFSGIYWLDNQRFAIVPASAVDRRLGDYIYNPFTAEILPVDTDQAAEFSQSANVIWGLLTNSPANTNNDGIPMRVFTDYDTWPHPVYVFDSALQQIYDTCIDTRFQFAISPSAEQVAVSIGQYDEGFVYILDLNEWVGYRLNLAANEVVGWFADPVP